MDKRTLRALRNSIKKWEKIVAGTGSDKGEDNCALCKLFAHDPDCAGCPVSAFTNMSSCLNTPYIKWMNLNIDKYGRQFYPMHFKATDDRLKVAAQAELDFLRSLLPTETVVAR